MKGGSRDRVALGLSGGVITVSVIVWAVQGDQTTRVASFLAWFAVAFVAYISMLRGAATLSPRALLFALFLAGAWRALLVSAPPLLSDDVYRSVWEGRVQLRGGNPYA
ncbi:MAG TPA: hypothetical protein VIC87_17810, partial [Vicinamibacteria bacterium]